MGLISGLLGLPAAPLRVTIAAAEQIQRQAAERFYDPARIRQELEAVDHMRRTGELSEAEADAREDELLTRLLGDPLASSAREET